LGTLTSLNRSNHSSEIWLDELRTNSAKTVDNIGNRAGRDATRCPHANSLKHGERGRNRRGTYFLLAGEGLYRQRVELRRAPTAAIRPSLPQPGNQTSPLNAVGITVKVLRDASIMATRSYQESAESTSNKMRPDESTGYRVPFRYWSRLSVFIFRTDPPHLSVVAVVELIAVRRRGDSPYRRGVDGETFDNSSLAQRCNCDSRLLLRVQQKCNGTWADFRRRGRALL
jgi:hypothetical protein